MTPPTRPPRRENRPRRTVTDGELRRAEFDFFEARSAQATEEARRNRLIADEIQHEQERKRASADEHRTFPFYTTVQDSSVRTCMEMLGEWSRLDTNKDRPFIIEITSPGGSVFDGLALFDYVRNLRDQGFTINTYGTGLIASMGTILMQMGEERTLGENSWFMVHELSDFIVGNLSEIEDGAKVARRINDRLFDILADRSTLTKKQIKLRSERKDWYLTAEEAVDLGFADTLR